MARKRHTPEPIIRKLREAEVELAKGLKTPDVVRELGITEQTYYRWCKEYGGLRLDQAKRLKELEKEDGRLKKLLAEQARSTQRHRPRVSGPMSRGSWRGSSSSPGITGVTATAASRPCFGPRAGG